MVKSFFRGHEAFLREDGNWYYTDNNQIVDEKRECKLCGKSPTIEGFDSCIGHIDNAISACCGHGVCKPYIIKNKNIT